MNQPKLLSITQSVMRIAIGFLFWSHGAQKFLGWFGGSGPDGGSAELASALGIAGVLEFSGGLLMMAGFLTRPVAFILSGEMAVAYFWRHVPQGGFWPWDNGGERAALFCFVFLFLSVAGAGALSVDAWRRRRAQRVTAA